VRAQIPSKMRAERLAAIRSMLASECSGEDARAIALELLAEIDGRIARCKFSEERSKKRRAAYARKREEGRAKLRESFRLLKAKHAKEMADLARTLRLEADARVRRVMNTERVGVAADLAREVEYCLWWASDPSTPPVLRERLDYIKERFICPGSVLGSVLGSMNRLRDAIDEERWDDANALVVCLTDQVGCTWPPLVALSSHIPWCP